jgi:hypothetical protein
MDSIENWVNAIHSIRCILIFSPNLRLAVPSGASPSGIPAVVCIHFSFLHGHYMLTLSALDIQARSAKWWDHW